MSQRRPRPSSSTRTPEAGAFPSGRTALWLALSAGFMAASMPAAAQTTTPAGQVTPAPAEAATTLQPVRVTGKTELNPTSEGTGSYAPKAVVVGKGAQTLREIPQSVTVVTQQRIQDQGLTNLNDVMTQMTGVTSTQYWLGSIYSTRGLDITNVRYDGGGVRETGNETGSDDLAQYDSVSLLRGSDGLFGAGEAGGVLNFQHKRPTLTPTTRATVTAGSWNNLREELDISRPLTEDGRVRGRLVGVYHDQDAFFKPGGNRRSMAYGALEADLTSSTTLLFGTSYQKDDRRGASYGVPMYVNGGDIGLPRSMGMGAHWSTVQFERYKIFGLLEQKLAAGWKAQLNITQSGLNTAYNQASVQQPVDPATNGGALWVYYMEPPRHEKTVTVDANVQGAFDALGRSHDVLLGADVNSTDRSRQAGGGALDVIPNIFNVVIPEQNAIALSFPLYPSASSQRKAGLYGSLRFRATDSWSVIAGGRYSLKDATYTQSTGFSGTSYTAKRQDNVLIPYLGTTYALTPSTNLYASTAEIFQSQANALSGPPGSGQALDPVRGRTYELGAKTSLNDRLLGSIALYRIEKKGAASQDTAYAPTAPGPTGDACCYVGDGYQLSQGFEAELNGALTQGWQASIGYTYNSNENKRQNDASFSTRTPRHQLKVFTTYDLGRTVQGLKVGGGVVAQSRSYTEGNVRLFNTATNLYDIVSPYQFEEPSRAIWSLHSEYTINPNWSLALNINNVFDKVYYRSVRNSGSDNYYGDPRNVSATLRAKF